MLRRWLGAGILTVLLAGLFASPVVSGTAWACTDGTAQGGADSTGVAGAGGTCTTPGTSTGAPDAHPSNGGSGRGEVHCYKYGSTEIPCTSKHDYGVWSGSCYEKVVETEPSTDTDYSFYWGDHEDGFVTMCVSPECDLDAYQDGYINPLCTGSAQWRADRPEIVGTVGPTAEELAQQAYAQMQLGMGEIGSTPPSTDGSVGLVGVPVWLWATYPGANPTAPTASASDGGLTVTVTGHLERIEWTLSDSSGVYSSVTCRDGAVLGTTWDESKGNGASPTCGFTAGENSRSGQVTLTGTAYWTADWAGAGLTGWFDVPAQSAPVTLDMGEVQVLTQ